MNLTDNRIQQITGRAGGNFSPEEFGIGRQHGNPEVIRQVALMRNWCDHLFQITSFWRGSGAHKEGAVDFLIWTEWRSLQPKPMQLWRMATSWPWLGVGIYFDWDDGIGLHGDLAASRERPLRWLRSDGVYYYESTIDGWFYSDNDRTSLKREIRNWEARKSDT